MIDLKSIFKQNPSCLNSRATFKSVLLDKYPSEKRMVNILTILFECGVASKIKAKKIISPNDMQGLLTQVENEYGIPAKYTQDAIVIWAAAFDVSVHTTVTQNKIIQNYEPISRTQSQNTSLHLDYNTTQPVDSSPPVYVEGDIAEYTIEKKADGYYITHFNGFEEEEMTIPSMIGGNPIRGIAQDAFRGCVTVKKVSISEGIEIIENRAFKDCKSLEAISFPNTLKRIGNNSKEYDSGAFSQTSLQEVELPPNVEFIGPYTFYFCFKLNKATISDKIKTICKAAFSHCGRLSSIKLPKNLLAIEEEAFSWTQLRDVHIPVGTQVIEKDAFRYINTLNSIYIPSTVTNIRSDSFDSYLTKYTIYCEAGSVAMEYARKNNIKCAKAQF